jgi:hypothetical protein
LDFKKQEEMIAELYKNFSLKGDGWQPAGAQKPLVVVEQSKNPGKKQKQGKSLKKDVFKKEKHEKTNDPAQRQTL